MRGWLGRRLVVAGALAALAFGGFTAAGVLASTPAATTPASPSKTCSSGYVHAIIGGQEKCLRNGEFCSAAYEADYEKYGFTCVSGRLETYTSTGPTSTTSPTTTTVPVIGEPVPPVGRTVLLKRRTRRHGCKVKPLPDRRCSPGAYYKLLTKAEICSSSFHTPMIRHVTQSEKYAVEREYGLKAKLYGHKLEIDHIVSLELGGNLFPEKAKFRHGAPGYHVKDKLENKLHTLVCTGKISLHSAQRHIAANWKKLYRKVYGAAP